VAIRFGSKDESTSNSKKGNDEKASQPSIAKASEPSLNMDELRDLANLLTNTDSPILNLKTLNIRVRLSKIPPRSLFRRRKPTRLQIFRRADSNAQPKTESQSKQFRRKPRRTRICTYSSPIVGTFYRSPAPTKSRMSKKAVMFRPDTIVCIIEAMKLMNEIEAETFRRSR
jgi:biotin carboxyl carrier protein